MTSDDRVNKRVGRLSKTRMEAFSDGVIAIAITLLCSSSPCGPRGQPWSNSARPGLPC